MRCQRAIRDGTCPYCVENVKRRSNHKGHWGYITPAPATQGIFDMIRRQGANSSKGADSPYAARDAGLEAEFPLLTEYLVARTFEDGSERETATLMIFAAEGLWKACLNDRAEGRCLWASGATHGDAMESLERMLDTGSAEWRSVKKYSPRKG